MADHMFVGIRNSELKKLYARSGNVCAFPDCRKVLVSEEGSGPMVVLGEAAHIVAETSGGPRGNSPMTPEERNRAANLLLLCARHHQLVDAQPATYTVEVLKQMKEGHELWVSKELGAELTVTELPRLSETVHSTLLAVTHLPRFVFSAPCDMELSDVFKTIGPFPFGQVSVFILREGRLIAFQDLSSLENPFAAAANPLVADRHALEEWLDDPDRARWVIELLNRSLGRHMAIRGLKWDKDHKRYYFPCPDPPQDVTVRYRGLNVTAERSVVWQPKRKATGEPRGHWYHLAVSPQFLRTGEAAMVLALRPELRITQDGRTPIASERIGARVTKRKSRLFNYDLLGEVNFWRDFLGSSRPHIKMEYGARGQFVIISTNLLSASVTWPGLPEEQAMPFKNVEYVDDLFSWAEVQGDDASDEDEEEEPNEEGFEMDDDAADLETSPSAPMALKVE